MATETHVAGIDFEVNDRFLIQRCAWCGAVLLAYDYANMATPGEWRKPSTFPPAALVRFSYDGTVAFQGDVALSRTSMEVIESDPDGLLPSDCCVVGVPYALMVPSEPEPTCGVEIPGIGPCTEPPDDGHEMHRRGPVGWNGTPDDA